MKKYKMRIKDVNASYKEYGFLVGNVRINNYIWLCNSSVKMFNYSHSHYEEDSKCFTMEEIEKMPYGFVNQYDLIEVKEQLYYIKLPHFTRPYCYLAEEEEPGIVSSADKYVVRGYKTKFTKQEIEEKFTFYANETCMVKVEDDE